MPDEKTTKLILRKDRPNAISSYVYGTGVDAVGFNLAFIALKNPRLAVEIIKLYSEASKVKEGDPQAPDEDLELYKDTLVKLITETSDNDF